MIKAIKKENPDKILILGTSDAMVEKIASNLKLPEIYQTIYITDIASPKQIEEARRSRIEEGKHIVPVPTFEIKKQFSGYFLDSLKVFNIFNNSQGKISTESTEKTIIRPTYSYLGNFYISDTVINRIISYTVCRIEGVTRVFKVTTQNYSNGMKLDIDIEVKFGIHLPELSNNIKNAVIFSVDYMTGLNLYSININIKSIKR